MSVQSQQDTINRLRSDIARLQTKVADESKKEAELSARINRNTSSITKTTSAASVRQKMTENSRMQASIADCQKRRAGHQTEISRKSQELTRKEADLAKEIERERKASMQVFTRQTDQLRTENRRLADQLAALQQVPSRPDQTGEPEPAPEQFDVFISHAWEDKDWVQPFAESLIERGVKVWYDDHQLRIGDRLRLSIDRGLGSSRFGILVLSPNFFRKNWTNYELDGLVTIEQSGSRKFILPLWHGTSKDEVMRHSPTLADKVALKTADLTVEEIVDQIIEVLKGA